MSTEINMNDLMNKFNEAFSKSIVKSTTNRDSNEYRWPSFEMCWNHGQIIGRYLVDANNEPFRNINHLLIGKIPTVNEEGKAYERMIKIAPIDEFLIKLEDHQIKMYNEILAKLDEYRDKMIAEIDKDPFKDIPKTTIFYMIIKKYINLSSEIEEYSAEKPTVMVHNSFNFASQFQGVINSRNNSFGTDWYNDFFGRTLGPSMDCISIKTSRPTAGYEMLFEFVHAKINQVEITQEILDASTDIYSEYFNAKKFDDEYYAKILKDLTAATELTGITIKDH